MLSRVSNFASWRLLAGHGTDPLVVRRAREPDGERPHEFTACLGRLYDFTPDQLSEWERRPLIVRALYGESTDCDVDPIIASGCTTTNTQDDTSIGRIEVGRSCRPAERLAGRPRRLRWRRSTRSAGLQDDFWQVNAYNKVYYYGFPWDATPAHALRAGRRHFLASDIPFSEQRDQAAARARHLEPALPRSRPSTSTSATCSNRAPCAKPTSASACRTAPAFSARAQLFGSVNGGSNYIYGYVEMGF